MKYFWGWVVLVLFCCSCSPEHTIFKNEGLLETPKDDEGTTGSDPLDLKPNYISLRDNLFKQQCLDCHNSWGIFSIYDFSTYESITSYEKFFSLQDGESRFVKSLVSGSMPKGKPRLSDQQIQVVREWVELGLPEDEEPTIKNFQDFKTLVLDPFCLRCHDSFMKYPIADHSQVLQNLTKIRWLIETDKMPPKVPIEADLKKKVFQWIDAGAPEF